MDYLININCKVSAKSEEEAKAKAVAEIKVREAAPLMLLPLHAYERLREFRNKKKEYFIVFLLNTQNEIIKREVISVGTLNASLIHPRETFEPAIRNLASHILIAHNHPSGTLEPSSEDLTVTKRLTEAGRLLGLEVIDHIIFSRDGFMSFRERNLL